MTSVVHDYPQEIGQYHMRIADGVATLLQIQGLCSKIFLLAGHK